MIKVKNLAFTYPGSSQPVLQGLSFEIGEGEIFGFLGPSGAGKSTTQKILYKILHGFSGEILVRDKPLHKWGKEYFESIGVGFELPNHYLKLSGKENLELFSSFYNKNRLMKIPELFEMVGLQESMNKKVEEYSKGMKMRLNFVRAIMNNPDILFFDEPTAGLDPVNGHKIKEHITNLKAQGKTIFITTHDMATADEICDRVAFIVDGKLQVTEAPSRLKHQHGENTVSVESKDGRSADFELENLGQNTRFLEFIKENQLLRINTKEATLEQVFIQVTGKALKV